MGCEISDDSNYRVPRRIYEDTESDDVIKKYHDRNGMKKNKKEIENQNNELKLMRNLNNKRNLDNSSSVKRRKISVKDSSINSFIRPNINIHSNNSCSNFLNQNSNLYNNNQNLNNNFIKMIIF